MRFFQIRGLKVGFCLLVLNVFSTFAMSADLVMQQASLTLCAQPNGLCLVPAALSTHTSVPDPHWLCIFSSMETLRGMHPVSVPSQCPDVSKSVDLSGDESSGFLLQTKQPVMQWLTIRYPWSGHHDWLVISGIDPVHHLLGGVLVQTTLQSDGSLLMTPSRITGYACAGGVRSIQQNKDGSFDLEENLDDLSLVEALAGHPVPSQLSDPMECRARLQLHRRSDVSEWDILGLSWQPGQEPFGPGCMDHAMSVYRKGPETWVQVPQSHFHALFRDYTTCHDQGVAPTLSD